MKTTPSNIGKIIFDYQNNDIIYKCYFCKKEDCTILSIYTDPTTEKNILLSNILRDDDRVICQQCWKFMYIGGRPTTYILRFLLKIIVLLKKIYHFCRNL